VKAWYRADVQRALHLKTHNRATLSKTRKNMIKQPLTSLETRALQQQLILNPPTNVTIVSNKLAIKNPTVHAADNMRAFFLLEKMALQCFKLPEIRAAAHGQISHGQWGFMLAYLTSVGVTVSTEGTTTTITTKNQQTAAAAFCIPGGRSFNLDVRWASVSVDPARMNAGLLPDAAATHLDPQAQVAFQMATENEQRAMVRTAAISGPLSDVTTDVQRKIGIDIGADGGMVITAVVGDLHVALSLSMLKVGYSRRHRHAKGGGSAYWHVMFDNVEAGAATKRTPKRQKSSK